MYVQHENQKQRANDTHTHSQTQRQGEREREKRMGSTSMATSSNPQGLHQVFVYGSLLSDEVVRVLLKRVPQSCPAILDGFHIFSIKECVYPAIIPVENKKVTGKVLLGITLPELDILDTFEDVEYNRCTVEVSLMHGGFSAGWLSEVTGSYICLGKQ
ncbi:AIG2-like protein D isoform X3 [Camellia sinensis]|uniref:AIG2-like protein D isoform X3 n=1 Tax=Camellia sinensis TaxID=4442 RepID=UPI0010355348|nr:AIG2-like protein D isoform X3 [Camellia sinensis]